MAMTIKYTCFKCGTEWWGSDQDVNFANRYLNKEIAPKCPHPQCGALLKVLKNPPSPATEAELRQGEKSGSDVVAEKARVGKILKEAEEPANA